MNNFIIYSIEIAVCLTLFYSAYWLFLKNDTFFKLNRFYLMFTLVISLLMPLLDIKISPLFGESSFISKYLILPVEGYEQNFSTNMNANYFQNRKGMLTSENGEFTEDGKLIADNSNRIKSSPLQTMPLALAKDSDQKLNWLNLVFIAYFIVAALILIRFLYNLIWITGHILRKKPQQISGMKVIRLEKSMPPFSFLNFVFLNQKDFHEDELTKIMAHEKVHITQKHSIDLILLELLTIFQWFNPVIWFYKRAVKITHEYLADSGALNSGVDISSYQFSLLDQALRSNSVEFTSSYNFSVKKRIAMMMKKRSSKLSSLKLIVSLPILMFLFSAFAFNCKSPLGSDQKNEANESVNKDSTIKKVDVPLEYLKLIEGTYVSTNEPGRVRRIIVTELVGTVFGSDNGYTYKMIPVGGEKFINPDDGVSLQFDTKDKNAITFMLAGKINMKKENQIKGSGKTPNKSLAFTLANKMIKNGIPAALSFYKAAKDSSNYYFTEREMNYAGYELLNSNNVKEAAAIFKLNTEVFPNSFNTFDSYGEALMVLGEKPEAIESFKKSMQLNPGSKNGIKRLKELGVNTDTLIKKYDITIDNLKLLEGVYLSTNQSNWMRKITLKVVDGELTGEDNGYNYNLFPMGEGKFINPDDGVSLVFDTKDKNAISFLIFGETTMKKVKPSKEPLASLKEYSGVYLPSKNDTLLRPMEIMNSNNKLFRFIETDPKGVNRTVELDFVTDNLFFYTDHSARSIEFVVNDKKQVTGCILRRPDGTYKLSKKK